MANDAVLQALAKPASTYTFIQNTICPQCLNMSHKLYTFKYKHYRKGKYIPFVPLQYYRMLILTVNKNYFRSDLEKNIKTKQKYIEFIFLNNRYWTQDFPFQNTVYIWTLFLCFFFLEETGQQDVLKDNANFCKKQLLNIIWHWRLMFLSPPAVRKRLLRVL